MKDSEDSVSEVMAADVWIPILAISAGIVVVIFVLFCTWKCRATLYPDDYLLLKDELALPQKLEMERKLRYDTMRETALLHCQFYLRSSGIYTPLEHLAEIGSRVDKHWFMVRDNRSKVGKLLTMLPRSDKFLLPFTNSTRTILFDMLHAIQHEYIQQVYDIDLLPEQGRVVLIQPYNSHGSLKDLIYHANCGDNWSSKYYVAGTGLSPNLVERYGRQILEALIFLKRSGFPPNTHLHSGNIILQNNICKLSGYENCLLGLSPKISTMMTKVLQGNMPAFEVISFGHLIYEMTMGTELEATIPQPGHLETIPYHDIKQCLKYIFTSTAEGYHSLEEIYNHPFFMSGPTFDKVTYKVDHVKFSKNQKLILKALRRGRTPNPRKPATVPTVAPVSHGSDKRVAGHRPTARDKEPTGRFQLPPPMTLRVHRARSKSPSQHAFHEDETKRKSPTPPQPKPTFSAIKPELPIRPQPTPPPRYASPSLFSTPMTSTEAAERTALLSEIKSRTSLKRVDMYPRL